MVRVGGGWEKLQEYVHRHEDEELDKIKKIMDENNKCYEEVILEFL